MRSRVHVLGWGWRRRWRGLVHGSEVCLLLRLLLL